MAVLTDDSIMAFGKHKGKKLINIPAKYFIWVYENPHPNPGKWMRERLAELKVYIEDNMDVLKKQMKDES